MQRTHLFRTLTFLALLANTAGVAQNKPAEDVVTLEFDRLRLVARGPWQARIVGASPQNQYLLAARRDLSASLVMTPTSPPGIAPKDYLLRIIALHTDGREILRRTPDTPAEGRTADGLPFAGQALVSKGADGSQWFTMYYSFGTDNRSQAIIAATDRANLFAPMVQSLAPGLERVTAIAPQNPNQTPTVVTPTPTGAPTTIYQPTGPMSDQFVSGVIQAQSAELKPAEFQIAWRARVGMGSVHDSDFVMSPRAPAKIVFQTESGTGVWANVEAAGRVMMIRQQGAPAGTPITKAQFQSDLRAASGGRINQPVNYFTALEMDSAGNLYVTATTEEKHNAVLMYRGGNAAPLLVVGPDQLARWSEGHYTWDDAGLFRVCPDGSGWLFVKGPRRIVILRMTRNGERIGLSEVRPTYNGQPLDTKRIWSSLYVGAPAWSGEYIFYSNGSFWALTPQGRITQLLKLSLPVRGVSMAGPVITRNNEIWFAFSTTYDVSSYVNVDPSSGHSEVRNSWFMVGDRSRLVRIRINAQRQIELHEISAPRIFQALAASGVPFDNPNADQLVMKTILLQPDFATGGLLLYDSHHRLMYSLTPAP